MKITGILEVMNLAKKARDNGMKFVPLFSGDAGLGKSEVVAQWVKEQNETGDHYGFIDLRIAQMEAPDFIGLPKLVVDANGRDRTSHILAEFWPEEGTKGVLFLDEVNRANTSNMNALMQLLTDRRIHRYQLPEGWIIVAAINPDGSGNYDVTSMDQAFQDRFEIYDVEFDHATFVKFAEANGWHSNVLSFVKAGHWIYKTPGEVGTEGKYISPRTWSKINVAEQCGLQNNPNLHFTTSVAKLGKGIGREYYSFNFENRAVTAEELANKKSSVEAFKRLTAYCDPKAYKGDQVSVTIQSVVDAFGKNKKVDLDLVCKVAIIIPQDQTVNFLQSIVSEDAKTKGSDMENCLKLGDFIAHCPELKDTLRAGVRSLNADKK